jgi:NRPS condensation-like uncharacterized protein
MNRKLILGERIMYVDQATPLNCVFTAKILGEFEEPNLRIALDQIQRKHPLLRMNIETINKTPYFVLNENIDKIPIREVDFNSDQDWLRESKTEWYKLFNQNNKPLARLVWIKGHLESNLILVLPHCICDGSTIVNLMQELLTLTDNPSHELYPYPSFSSVNEFFPNDYVPRHYIKRKTFAALGRLFFLFKPTSGKSRNQNNYAINWKLSKDETRIFISKCKAEKTTVHAAICSIFIDVFRTLKGDKAHAKVICPVDIRRFIPGIKADTMFAFAPIAELKVSGKNGNTWENARMLKADLDQKISEMNIPHLLHMSESFHPLANKMIGFLRSTNGSHDITLSNMGSLNIKQHYKTFSVETIYSPTVAFPWKNANTLVVSTFNNQLDFSLMSDENFLKEFDAMLIKAKVLESITAQVNALASA